jgi:hypothetical protein
MRLTKELSGNNTYWTKDNILNLLQQMIDLSRKFDEREKEKQKLHAEADDAITSLQATAELLRRNKK